MSGWREWIGLRSRAPAAKSQSFDLSLFLQQFAPAASSGVVVTEESALQVATVLACVRLVADDVAKLPLAVYRRQPQGGDQRAVDAVEDAKLAARPNALQTSFEFRWMMTARAMVWGESLAVKEVVGGRIDHLWPLAPGEWSVELLPDWTLAYTVTLPFGETMRLGTQDVLHLRRLPWRAHAALRPVSKAREAIGLAAAAEQGQAKVFGNGSRPSGILTTDASLADEQINNLVTRWKAATSGENLFGVPVLDSGLKFMPMSLSAVDSQAVETRKHQIIEVCAALGVLPAVLGVDDKTTAFASVEAMLRAHLNHTIEPWLVCWQQALDRDVLDGNGPLYARFDRTMMERASEKEQADADRARIESGLRTPNELRARDGLPPLPGGDALRMPMNIGRATDDASTA